MSDLYHETAEGGTVQDRSPGSGHGTSAVRQHENSGPEPGRGYDTPTENDDLGEYNESEAETEIRIAAQDQLPTPGESRATTWGPDAKYDDETELAAEYDGDINSLLADEDRLPTPQESRRQTWSDTPDFYDEADLGSEYDGDLDALTEGGVHPTAADAPGSPDTEDSLKEPAVSVERTAEVKLQDADAGTRDQDSASATPENPVSPSPRLTAVESPSLSSTQQDEGSADAPAITGEGQDGATRATDTQNDPPADAGTGNRIAELEENLADLQARFERLERASQAETPRPSGDNPVTVMDALPAAHSTYNNELAGRKSVENDSNARYVEAESPRWRRIMSSEKAGLASTILGATETVTDFAMHPSPMGSVGLAALGFGLVSLGLAKLEKRRKEKGST